MLAALLIGPPRAALAVALAETERGATVRTRSGVNATLRGAVTPEEMAKCEQFMSNLYTEPMTKKRWLPKIVRRCRRDKAIEDARKVCPHLGAALAFTMDDVPEDEKLSAGEFCTLAEERIEGLEGAFHVPNMGSGDTVNFQVSPQCGPTVEAVLGTEGLLKTEHLPDFWYALCMNQDCAHFLPSRTKWCDTARPPTHSAMVCEAARGFAKFKIGRRRILDRLRTPEEMKSDQICSLYANFEEEVGMDLKTWKAVAHGEKGPPLNKKRKPFWHAVWSNPFPSWGGATAAGSLTPLAMLLPALAALIRE